MSLFLVTYLFIYGSIHVYFHRKAHGALHFKRFTAIAIGIVLCALFAAPIIVRIAERQGHEHVALILAYIGYGWMALLFSFFVFSLTLDGIGLIRRLASRGKHFVGPARQSFRRIIFVSACLYACGTYIWGYFEARDIEPERLTISSSKLPDGSPPIKIVQLTDVHLGLIIKEDRLARILDVVKSERPDILVSTGDLVDGRIAPLHPGRTDIPRMALMFHEIEPPLGKFAVTGNHEYYAGLRQALNFTKAAGFTVLHEESVPVGQHLAIAGVDDMAGFQRKEIPRPSDLKTLAAIDPARFILFLKHRPRIEAGAEKSFDLQLSGHVHKGQIFPFNLIEWFFYPVRCGLTKLDSGSLLYTSRGTGTWGPPARFLAPPEVTVITITPQQK
jgi:predicted MPP superfamily phosphohydrolase